MFIFIDFCNAPMFYFIVIDALLISWRRWWWWWWWWRSRVTKLFSSLSFPSVMASTLWTNTTSIVQMNLHAMFLTLRAIIIIIIIITRWLLRRH